MEELAQFYEEVRLGQEEAAAKVLKKACYDNSCVSYSIPLMIFACADLVASLHGHNYLGCSKSSIFMRFILCGFYFFGVMFFVGFFAP